MTTTDTINALLQQLGWQAYIPAFALLLQRFAGTEDWLEQDHDSLPECLSCWLASLVGEQPKPLGLVALCALRRWPLLYFRAYACDAYWDYRQCSFHEFCQQAGEQGITVWFSPHRAAFPTLLQGLGFLRQHRLPGGELG